MARFKNVNWNCGNGTSPDSCEHAQLAVMMDIRDELKALNSKLDCYRVRRTLDAVQRIDKRMSKMVKLK